MVNLSASFLTAGQGVRVTGGVTNLPNKAILISGFADLQGSSIADGTYGRPREWYLTVRYSFRACRTEGAMHFPTIAWFVEALSYEVAKLGARRGGKR